jgi:hypothetical protein
MTQEYYRRELDLKHISGNTVLSYGVESKKEKLQSRKYKIQSRKYKLQSTEGCGIVMNDVVL